MRVSLYNRLMMLRLRTVGRLRRRARIARIAGPHSSRLCSEQLEPRVVLSAWYVAPYGADANPGSLQQPFASIQAAANVALPGDTVYIRGGTYHETVTPLNSGTAEAPIIYTPYQNESVTLDGADPITGWTLSRGKIYTAPQTWDLGEGNNQVFLDGKMVNEARFPNTGTNPSTPVWAKAAGVSVTQSTTGLSTVTIFNSALTQPAGTWVGAVAHIATGQEWVAQTGTVIASAPGSVTVSYFQESTYQVPRAGNRFYLVGANVALNSANEWYRDPVTGLLNLWDPSSDAPTKHAVEAKARQYAFDLSSLSYIDVQQIRLVACTINTDASSSNLLLDQLNASYVSQSIGVTADTQDPWGAKFHPHTSGIILNGQNNILQNSTIAYSSGDGVFVGGSNNTVQNCTIHDVDYEGGDEAGITTLGDSESILFNTIYNTGRSGIVTRYTTHSFILHNVVHNVGMQMTDLGAIYTWDTDGQGTEIGYNLVYNVHTGGFGAAGIYLDNGSQNYAVDHNVVWNADYALKLNPPSWNNLIINNTFSGTAYGLQTSGSMDMTGSVLENNIFTRRAMLGVGLTQSNNLFTPTNPQFVSTSASNYQLLATSPAVDSGTALSPYTDGYVGAAPDIGAYESGVAPFTAGATPLVSSIPQAFPANVATNYFSPRLYNSQWSTATSGDGIRFTRQWGWEKFSGVDFGTGLTQWIAQVSRLPAQSERIQIRLDSPSGPAAATITLPASTQPASTVAQTFSSTLVSMQGVHDVYVMVLDAPTGGEVDGFTFVPPPPPPPVVPPVVVPPVVVPPVTDPTPIPPVTDPTPTPPASDPTTTPPTTDPAQASSTPVTTAVASPS